MQSLRVRSTPHNGQAASNDCQAGLCVQTKPTTELRVFSLYGKPIRFRLEEGANLKGFPIVPDLYRNHLISVWVRAIVLELGGRKLS
jgi:hypothetical protein